MSKKLYINEIQNFKCFCTRDGCLEKGTKCVIILLLKASKDRYNPFFEVFFRFCALFSDSEFQLTGPITKESCDDWLVSLQKMGVTGSNSRVRKPFYGEVSRLASEQKSSVEGLRRPCGKSIRLSLSGHKGDVMRSQGCCDAVTRVS